MPEQAKYKIVLGFAAIYLIWGSTYLAIRFGVETMPPFLMGGLRFLTGGLIFYAVARSKGAEKPRLSHWWPATIIGILLTAGGTGLVSWAEKTVPSGLTALLVAMVPMWIVLADWLRPGGVARPSVVTVLGLVLGFGGVALLIDPTDLTGNGSLDKVGAAVVVLATMFWAIGSIYSRYAHQPRSKWLGAGMQMIAGGLSLFLISLFSGELSGFAWSAVTAKSWLALGYLISLGSLGFGAYIWLLSASTPSKVATYAYVNPVIALALGNMLAGEELSMRTLGCSVVILFAVIIIITARARSGRVKSPKGTPAPCCEANGIKA